MIELHVERVYVYRREVWNVRRRKRLKQEKISRCDDSRRTPTRAESMRVKLLLRDL